MNFAWRSFVTTIAVLGLVPNLIGGLRARPLFHVQADESTSSKEEALKRTLFEMREAIDQYYLDNQRYPKNLKALETDGYIAKIPKDPFTERNDSWRTLPAKPIARGRRQPGGIYDVKSGSKRIAMDGTRYSDW